MIHQYKLGDLCVVLDVCSGSVHAVDEVAYVRFASVYREFKDVNTFMDELKKFLK